MYLTFATVVDSLCSDTYGQKKFLIEYMFARLGMTWERIADALEDVQSDLAQYIRDSFCSAGESILLHVCDWQRKVLSELRVGLSQFFPPISLFRISRATLL